MGACKFLKLMSNKITSRAYNYFLEFTFHFNFENNDFSNYVKNWKMLLEKHKGFYGIEQSNFTMFSFDDSIIKKDFNRNKSIFRYSSCSLKQKAYQFSLKFKF